MKKTAIYLVSLYQMFINVILKNILGVNKFCRYSPTCSEYTKIKIQEKGFIKGSLLSIARISKCHPFAKNV
jgi:uncharacterized protein